MTYDEFQSRLAQVQQSIANTQKKSNMYLNPYRSEVPVVVDLTPSEPLQRAPTLQQPPAVLHFAVNQGYPTSQYFVNQQPSFPIRNQPALNQIIMNEPYVTQAMVNQHFNSQPFLPRPMMVPPNQQMFTQQPLPYVMSSQPTYAPPESTEQFETPISSPPLPAPVDMFTNSALGGNSIY